MLLQLKKELRSKGSFKKAKIYQRFFKTGKGEYGEGDVFIGVTVPDTRTVAKKYSELPFKDISALLKSDIHEERLCALLMLVHAFSKAEQKERKKIYDFYLASTKYINNWDLVDLSAHNIVGQYVLDNPKEKIILKKLAASKNLWERRIAIIATYQCIRENQFQETLEISEILRDDTQDLIHKAVGWMLREVGNRSLQTEEKFLKKHYKKMPRTMLRYAIEKFPESKRKSYLQGEV